MTFTASPHHVGLSVADLEAEERWYRLSLGLTEVVERVELPEPAVRTVVLRAPSGLPSRADRGRWFDTVISR